MANSIIHRARKLKRKNSPDENSAALFLRWATAASKVFEDSRKTYSPKNP
jgi:hypothetical protein